MPISYYSIKNSIKSKDINHFQLCQQCEQKIVVEKLGKKTTKKCINENCSAFQHNNKIKIINVYTSSVENQIRIILSKHLTSINDYIGN